MPDFHNIRLPAGWYPDPEGGEFRRWWDGKTWTQHTAPFQRHIAVYDAVDSASDETDEEAATPSTPAPRRLQRATRLGAALAAATHRITSRKNGRHKG